MYDGGWKDGKQSCTYCHKMGHVLKDCRFTKNNNNRNFNSNSNQENFNNSNNNARPVNVVTVENLQNNVGLCQIEFIKSNLTSYNGDKSLDAFVRPVCFYSKDNSHCVSVKGYRDSGAKVTLMLEDVLKSECYEYTGKTVDLVFANGSKDKVSIMMFSISNDVCICMVPISYRFPSGT